MSLILWNRFTHSKSNWTFTRQTWAPAECRIFRHYAKASHPWHTSRMWWQISLRGCRRILSVDWMDLLWPQKYWALPGTCWGHCCNSSGHIHQSIGDHRRREIHTQTCWLAIIPNYVTRAVNRHQFSSVKKVVIHMLSIFGSTYTCESSF